jgi:hypothetical protein
MTNIWFAPVFDTYLCVISLRIIKPLPLQPASCLNGHINTTCVSVCVWLAFCHCPVHHDLKIYILTCRAWRRCGARFLPVLMPLTSSAPLASVKGNFYATTVHKGHLTAAQTLHKTFRFPHSSGWRVVEAAGTSGRRNLHACGMHLVRVGKRLLPLMAGNRQVASCMFVLARACSAQSDDIFLDTLANLAWQIFLSCLLDEQELLQASNFHVDQTCLTLSLMFIPL